MAYWGEAMTHDHPLWGQQDESSGRAVLERLSSLDARNQLKWSKRERAYVDAIRQLYEGRDGVAGRREAYAEAMQRLAERYPHDDEAAVFAALAAMSAPGFDLESAADVVRVAAPLEEIYQKRPHHPGVLHYLIHVYDSPTFAALGLRPARTYADIAPSASHALHMPSHIFRHLGQWEKVVASNQDAWDASVEWQERTGRPLMDRDYHAFRWIVDGYLRLGRFDEACELLKVLDELVVEARRQGEDQGYMPIVAEDLGARLRREAEQADLSDVCSLQASKSMAP